EDPFELTSVNPILFLVLTSFVSGEDPFKLTGVNPILSLALTSFVSVKTWFQDGLLAELRLRYYVSWVRSHFREMSVGFKCFLIVWCESLESRGVGRGLPRHLTTVVTDEDCPQTAYVTLKWDVNRTNQSSYDNQSLDWAEN
ncbi:hypothetical protein AVEN_161950-1, partial [Araneus ventricosus]